ncbi:MAG: polyketide cyclase, partial [Candidatus Omnitrophica bacterium]|nr:polyketide cyclase [Candidatus Omnitrophota bacterium]
MKNILMIFGLLVAVFVVVVALQPDDFRISRSSVISAPPQKVFDQVNDFHNWA